MDGFWRGLVIIILLMLLVRCDANSSLYKSEDNGIRLEVPRFLVTPVFWLDKQVGQPFKWGYNSPFADDYHFQFSGSEEEASEQ